MFEATFVTQGYLSRVGRSNDKIYAGAAAAAAEVQ
jgi:hypothetical protein